MNENCPGALAGAAEAGIGYAERQSNTTGEAALLAARGPASGADFVTVLTRGPLATKWVVLRPGATRSVIEAYGNAAFFSICEAPVSGIDDLPAMLGSVERPPSSFVLRGNPTAGGRSATGGVAVMTPLETALAYALPVFPCSQSRRPRTPRGFHDATTDLAIITAWWSQWPDALIAMPTGQTSGRWVLDIDVKRQAENGFETLEDLGYLPLPETPMAHTQSGGVHVYYSADRELRNSAGIIGPGLDVRGDGGYVILPSPGSGYAWDPVWNFTTTTAKPAPDWLWPVKPSRRQLPAGRMEAVDGLSPYGRAAIEGACDAIARAPHGQQERTLNAECFSIGTAVGAGIIPHDIALKALRHAAAGMPDYDPRLPWRAEEIDHKVRRAFDAGCANPREVRRALA